MYKGFVKFTDGNKEVFTFEKLNAYIHSLTSDIDKTVNLGDLHAVKSQISYIKFTEIPNKEKLNGKIEEGYTESHVTINEEELIQYIYNKAFEQAVPVDKEQIQKVLELEMEFLKLKGVIEE